MGIDKDDLKDAIEASVEDKTGLAPGENEVILQELYAPEFMQEYTEFDSIESLLEATKWDIQDEADLQEVPEEELDDHVEAHSEFSSWEEMKSAAGNALIQRRLDD